MIMRTCLEGKKNEIVPDQRWGQQLLTQRLSISDATPCLGRSVLGVLDSNRLDAAQRLTEKLGGLALAAGDELSGPLKERSSKLRASQRKSERVVRRRASEEDAQRELDERWLETQDAKLLEAERHFELQQAAMARRRTEDLQDIDKYIEHVEDVLQRMMLLCSAAAAASEEGEAELDCDASLARGIDCTGMYT